MAPIRRYLRISKYSVLECRIYLENPADSRWLVDTRDAALPRVIDRIRPLVLPKLREENERARAKKKSKPLKDVLVEGTAFLFAYRGVKAESFAYLFEQQMTLRYQSSSEKPGHAIRL